MGDEQLPAEFVKAYYAALTYRPDLLHHFYHGAAHVVRNGQPGTIRNQRPDPVMRSGPCTISIHKISSSRNEQCIQVVVNGAVAFRDDSFSLAQAFLLMQDEVADTWWIISDSRMLSSSSLIGQTGGMVVISPDAAEGRRAKAAPIPPASSPEVKPGAAAEGAAVPAPAPRELERPAEPAPEPPSVDIFSAPAWARAVEEEAGGDEETLGEDDGEGKPVVLRARTGKRLEQERAPAEFPAEDGGSWMLPQWMADT